MFKLKIKNKTNKTNGKCGVIQGTKCGNPYFVEIEEIIRADKLSKVRMLELCMENELWQSDVYDEYKGDTWINTSRITWYDDNAQKRRDRTLRKLLN